jgi:hypothetical protein
MVTRRHRSASLISVFLLMLGALAQGCARVGVSPSPTALELGSASPPPPSAVPARSSPVASLRFGPELSSAAVLSDPPMAEPPAASIAVEGGDPVAGELGSFSWAGSGSDSPWLEGNPFHMGTGEQLTMTLAGAVPVATWTAARVPPVGLDAVPAVGLGEGSGSPVAFAGTPRGTWSVRVSVWFAEDLGSATYYWLIDVD